MIRNACLAFALALALLFTPLGGAPFADGLPLDSPWELIIIALLVWAVALTAAYPTRHGPWVVLLILALLVVGAKVFVYQHQLPHGLAGRYRTEPPGVGPKWERTLHRPLPDATRLDGPLAFYNTGYRPGKPPFPFFFFNDKRRHPWIGNDSTMQPTVHVHWDGYLAVDRPGQVAFRLETTDTCGLTLDGRVLIALGEGLEHCGRGASVELTAGLHPLRVTYTQHITDLNAPSPKSRLLLQWRQGEGLWEVVPARALLPFRPTTEALDQDRGMRPLAQWLFWGQWVLLAVGLVMMFHAVPLSVWRGERGLLACVALLLIALALATTLRDARPPASNYIWLGSDEIHYEGDARAFIMESWVSTPSTGNEPKILYVYFLATAHLLLGEPLVQMVLLQRLLLVSAAFLIYWIGKTFFSPRVGLYAMMLTVLSTQLLGWSRALYPASLATALLALALVCILQAHRHNSVLWMVGAGVALSLGVHARPNFILCYVVVLLWLAASHRPWRKSFALMGTFGLGIGFVEGLAIIRSLAAYGTLFTYQNILPINLMRGNPIP
ncbi:glycosyltransferase family 39 protein, partial [Nitrospinae bacterium AH-259-F20]|nr:glycosyltransferase family 39 protein [Nitrospinae bacterium AH-259-F20]